MKRLLAATATLSLLAAAGPALAAAPKNGACKAPAGATVLKPGAQAVESTPTTPVGAGNDLVLDAQEDAGTFVLDLAGRPEGTRGKITLTLAWDNPLSDYDLVVGGTNELSTDNPEVRTVSASHCRAVKVAIDVFTGVPVDALTLTAKGA